jgi:membrane protease YdiL (CAAX protease family)
MSAPALPVAPSERELVAAGGGPRRWIAAHPFLAVVLLTYALTWAVLVPLALESHGWLPVSVPALATLGVAWGPAIAAVVVVAALGGRRGVRAYLKRLLRWRVHPGWYALALFGPAAYILAGVGLARLLSWSSSPLPAAAYPPAQVALGFVLTLLVAMVINTEEFAWRGVALPLLQRHPSALVASLVLGAVHALWHLPYFFTAGRPFYEQVGFPVFAAWTLALTIILTWIYNCTGGSLLLPVLFHAGQFAWQQLLSPPEVAPFFISVGLLWAVAVGVIAIHGPANLAAKSRETLDAALRS